MGKPFITGFHHVAINVRDFDASVRFYTETLGLVPKISWGEAGKRAIMLDTGGGAYVELFEKRDLPPVTSEGPIIHFALRTDRIDELMVEIRKLGLTVTMETKDVAIPTTTHGPGVVPIRISFFRGLDGEIIELFQNEYT